MTAASAAAATAAAAAFLFSSPAFKARIPHYALKLYSKPHLSRSRRFPLCSTRTSFFPLRPRSAVQDIAVEEEEKESVSDAKEEDEKRRKLFVVNLPWNFSAPDIEKLFGECGTVKDVEIIKQKNGKSRGFAFIVMASAEEASAAVAKFDSFELMGRIIRVEFAKNFRKPSPPPPPPPPPPGAPKTEGRYKIYASNLAWKVRSTNLRDLFSEKFKPLSARVVFDSPTGRSAGYGFVGFATMEEVESAISEFDGKELMGRPLCLKISQRSGDESGEKPEKADDSELKSLE